MAAALYPKISIAASYLEKPKLQPYIGFNLNTNLSTRGKTYAAR